MKKILVFSSREICYFSGTFFSEQLGNAMERLGYEVERCHIAPDEDYEEKLETYVDQEFACIIDINSILPRLGLEDGSSYLGHLNGPFFDYIVDHPLFHHNCLINATERMHVLLLDEMQKRYVEDYYPQVKASHMLPLTGNEAISSDGQKRDKKVLMIGTFESDTHIKNLIEQSGEVRKKRMLDMIDQLMSDPELTYEGALRNCLEDQGIELTTEEFAIELNALYPVQFYLRNHYRKEAVLTLTSHHIPVRIIGDGWDKLKIPDETYLERKAGIHIAVSYEAIADSYILFNCSPFFNHGVHDRVFAGMANRAAVLTEDSAYIRRHYKDKGLVSTYQLTDFHTLADQAEELILNHDRWKDMTEAAYECYKNNHTWDHRARSILSYL